MNPTIPDASPIAATPAMSSEPITPAAPSTRGQLFFKVLQKVMLITAGIAAGLLVGFIIGIFTGLIEFSC
jgi:hypothetical protein